jgi:hypothetical protein
MTLKLIQPMKMPYLAGIHFALALLSLFAFIQVASAIDGMEQIGVGKGKVVAWIGALALLIRTGVLWFLQQTRFRARLDYFSHPYVIVAAVGILDGLSLLPLFSIFGRAYYSSVSDPSVESLFLVLLGPIALLSAVFPAALNAFWRIRMRHRERS